MEGDGWFDQQRDPRRRVPKFSVFGRIGKASIASDVCGGFLDAQYAKWLSRPGMCWA